MSCRGSLRELGHMVIVVYVPYSAEGLLSRIRSSTYSWSLYGDAGKRGLCGCFFKPVFQRVVYGEHRRIIFRFHVIFSWHKCFKNAGIHPKLLEIFLFF